MKIEEIVTSIGARFRCFGEGRKSDTNPIVNALTNSPLQFAGGVDVRGVVEFVLAQPRDMLIFCPNCGKQHIDKPEPDMCVCGDPKDVHHDDADAWCGYWQDGCECRGFEVAWNNPPHKSHTCRLDYGGCGFIFRVADFPTNGVTSIETRGEKDTWPEVK